MDPNLTQGHDYILFIALAAFAIRMAEAYLCGIVQFFKNKELTASGFFATNTMWLVVVFACAILGWSVPVFSMLVAPLLLLQALIHLIHTIKHHQWMPGLLSAVLLYIPIGVALYVEANRDGVLTWMTGILGVVWALLLTILPWFGLHHHHRKKK
jgi:hypothetical protein